MGMAAPKGTQAPAAGLAAIAQPAQAPKGMSSGNMAQVMAMARKMSDGQLAEVLQGKSLSVPQYVAMTEAMGRKSLRTAMDGQQAMAQAKQPSVKDKLLMGDQPQMQGIQQGMPQMPQQPVMAASGGLMYADGGAIDMNEGQAAGGLAELPAPNMEGLTLAGGGIVAFQDNPNQPVREGMPPTDLTEEEKKQLAENPYMRRVQAVTNPGKAISEYFANRPSSEELFNRASKAKSGEVKMFTNEQTPKGKLVEAGLVERTTPIQDVPKVAAANLDKKTALNAVDREEAAAGAGMRALAEAQQRQAKPAPAPADINQRSNDRRAALAGTDTSTGITPERRANPFGALKADLPDYAKVKSQGLGEGLMVLSGALFGNPNLAMALNQGLPALAKVSGATRKELSDIKKDYNAQQLSLAKANELFEAGQEDLAFKKLAQSQNHAVNLQKAMAATAAANKPSGTMELFNTVQRQNPNMSALDIISAMSGAKENVKIDARSDQALRDKYAGDKTLQLLYPNIDDYIRKMTPAGATMAGNTGGFSRGVFDINGRPVQ
jgi:hypothetical protein